MVSADLSLSDHGHGDVSQLYRVSANGPLSSNNVGVSFTAFWKDYNGFIDDALSDDVDDYEFFRRFPAACYGHLPTIWR